MARGSPAPPAVERAAASHAKLFLSYSRKDHAFVERLNAALAANGHDIWVDLEDIHPSEEWLAAIRAAIEAADAFVFVVSPDSVHPSSVCKQEIDHAVLHNKRMIPVVCREVDTRAVAVPDAVARLNWVSFLDADAFDRAVDALGSALRTDLEWLKQHTRLVERAVEWDTARRDDSFLLQKNDLAAAERWLTLGPTKEPRPTALQTQYVVSSRTASTKRQRRTQAALAVGLLLTTALAVVAWFQRSAALTQANIALSRQLIAQAEVLDTERPDLLQRGVLLAVESLRRFPTLEADQFLRRTAPLLPQAVGSPLPHKGAIQAVTFSPDGGRVATAAWDGTAGVWDAATGRSLFVLQASGASRRVGTIAFSADGTRLATSDADGLARVWNAADGQPIGAPVRFRNAAGNAAAFTPDGRYLVTQNAQGAQVWDIAQNEAERAPVFASAALDMKGQVIQADSGTLPCLPLSTFLMSADGTHAAIACRGQIMFVDTAGWQVTAVAPYQPRPGLRPPHHAIAFSADGKYFASADEVYDVASHTLVAALHAPVSVTAVAFSPDAELLALAAGDVVRLVQRRDGVQLAEFRHARGVRAVAFSPDGKTLASASDDHTARIWSVDPPREVARIGHDRPVSCLAFSPDGRRLATGSEDQTARIWQVTPEPDIPLQRRDDRRETAVALSADGRFAAWAAGDAIHVRDTVTGREEGRLTFRDGATPDLQVAQASLSPDARYLWTSLLEVITSNRGRRRSSPLKSTRLWDVKAGTAIATIEFDGEPDSAVFSPDSKLLAFDDRRDSDLGLRVWDVARRQQVGRLPHESRAEAVFSRDGRYLALVSDAIVILEASTLREVQRLAIGSTTFGAAAFSHDGRRFAAASNDAVRIRDTAGTAERTLAVPSVSAIEFSPDGSLMATATWDFANPAARIVSIWQADSLREIGRLPMLDVERASNVSSSSTRMAFSRDGRYLAFENQGMLRIWDSTTSREVARWENGYSSELAFDAGGEHVVSRVGDAIAVWAWRPEALRADVCKRLARELTADEWSQYLPGQSYRGTCSPLTAPPSR